MYNFTKIEKKWQKYWDKNKTFKTDGWDFSKPKFYALDMFPYPSGVGLHAGHPEGYTATDVVCRMKECKDIMSYIQWDMIHLVFLQNNMPFKQEIIQQYLLMKILKHLELNYNH